MVDEKIIWNYLEEVHDPEVPVLSIIDLGIVRDVQLKEDQVNIVITPTYSGCPAMKHIESEIKDVLKLKGIDLVSIDTVLKPAWTTDWISENGKTKLLEYGIAPPIDEPDKSVLFSSPLVITCPQCGSNNTKMVSLFGSTACKAQYQCNECLEPFDYFKCLK